jgi:ketosteroid isomerase-like protein
MAEQTATALEGQVRRIYEFVDAMDMRAMAEMLTDDAQGVDEISRAWMRGRDALESYFAQLDQMVDEVHSKVSDVHSTEWGDVGVVTCVVDQTYLMDGVEQNVTAPTSITFRREGGDWKVALFHAVPLADEPED